MDLFRNISKGKFGQNKELKKEAKHELKELGGKKKATAYEKALRKVKIKRGDKEVRSDSRTPKSINYIMGRLKK